MSWNAFSRQSQGTQWRSIVSLPWNWNQKPSQSKELDLVLIRVDDQFCEYILVPLQDFPRLAVSLWSWRQRCARKGPTKSKRNLWRLTKIAMPSKKPSKGCNSNSGPARRLQKPVLGVRAGLREAAGFSMGRRDGVSSTFCPFDTVNVTRMIIPPGPAWVVECFRINASGKTEALSGATGTRFKARGTGANSHSTDRRAELQNGPARGSGTGTRISEISRLELQITVRALASFESFLAQSSYRPLYPRLRGPHHSSGPRPWIKRSFSWQSSHGRLEAATNRLLARVWILPRPIPGPFAPRPVTKLE